ncbi:phage tail protein [Actinobacillus pleuropneumoniae]|nr:phage tail protein [Actinobacillus pleuropneumoniae]
MATAVTQLQQTDAQQAQLITAVTAKADQAIAGLQEEQTARANADKAEAQARNALTSRVASAESSISNIQSTKASKTEVASLAQQSLQAVWQADAQAKVDALSVGGRNLLLKSNATNLINFVRSSQDVLDNTDFRTPVVRINCIQDSWFGRKTAITPGKLLAGKYTLSFKYRTNATINNTFIGYGNNQQRRLITSNAVGDEAWQACKLTFETTEDYQDIFIIIGGYGTADVSYIEFAELKLERGTIATDWTPAPEDADSAINAISSKVDSVQQTLTTANQALGSRIDTVTASVNDAKSQVSQVSKAVSDVSGKLSATHTLKTQVINGGRMAIAGIALGAESDGVTTESSVIVVADKFGIVANANDGKVKPVFSVADGQVGIRGDLFVAGSVTHDKLSSGSGANLLQNPIFSNDAHSWYDNKGNGSLEPLVTKLTRRTSQSFAGLVSSGAVLISEVTANQSVSSWWQVAAQKVSVIPGQRYCFSAYVDAWSCTGELMIQEWDATDNWVKDFAYSGKFGRNILGYSQSGAMEEKTGNIDSRTRKSVFFTAPQSGIVALVVRMADIQRSSTIKVANAMLEECSTSSTEPSPWSNAGAGPVHGGSIIANTIRGEHIQANQRITAPMIEGGSLNISNRFKVSNSGQVEMRSNSGNVGMVMNNDAIIVYDEWGKPRVKIGKLS